MNNKKIIFVAAAISIFALTSCWQTSDSKTSDWNKTQEIKFGSSNFRKSWSWARSWSGRIRFGSWSWDRRTGSGWFNRFWSWSEFFNKLSTEDRKLFEEMRVARESGDMEKMRTIREQLQKKYPEIMKGRPPRNDQDNANQKPSETTN